MRKIRILLITSMPWREDNNIGNSYSNLFGGIENIEFAHIYCRDGMPQNKLVNKYFQITEKSLFNNLKNRKFKTGKEFFLDDPMNTGNEKNSAVYDKMRILRWELFFIARDLLWKVGKWKTKELDKFVEDFQPDIIFGTLTYMPNINEIMQYLKKKYKLPLIIYSWDDVYSLKHYSWSPFFWIRKFYQRKAIRNTVNLSEFMYTITKEMKEEYQGYFNKECRLLYKGYKFTDLPSLKEETSAPLKLVFMGNIGAGRWKALAKLVEAVSKINRKEMTATIDIYTLSPKSVEMCRQLEIDGTSRLMDVVPSSEVMKTQKNADILVHVEPYDKADVSFYRLSFSTKIVDYFYNARCIIALGGKTATMTYLEDNDAGLVYYDLDNLEMSLKDLFSNRKKIYEYGQKAWDCGYKNHQESIIKNELYNTFKKYSQIK